MLITRIYADQYWNEKFHLVSLCLYLLSVSMQPESLPTRSVFSLTFRFSKLLSRAYNFDYNIFFQHSSKKNTKTFKPQKLYQHRSPLEISKATENKTVDLFLFFLLLLSWSRWNVRCKKIFPLGASLNITFKHDSQAFH